MSHAVAWWFAAQFLGLLALPATFRLFRPLPDRGYAFAKPFGLLVVSYVLWIAAQARLLPNARGSIILILAVLAAGSLWLLRGQRHDLAAFLRRGWPVVLVTEALFLLMFVVWAYIRSHNPDIAGTEKPMDFAFLNGVLRSEYFPPRDPWLSGHSISYYYGGYLMMAVLTKLTGTPSGIAFNLSLALLAAMTATGVFSVVYNLVARHRQCGRAEDRIARPLRPPSEEPGPSVLPGDGTASASVQESAAPLPASEAEGNPPERRRRWLVPSAFGLVGVVLLLLLGNMEGILEVARAHNFRSPGFWEWVAVRDLGQPVNPQFQSGDCWYPYKSDSWYPADPCAWWRASRVVGTFSGGETQDYTINEFPFFSFLLGDLHPHVLGLPFTLMAIGLAMAVFYRGVRPDIAGWRRNWPLFLALALVLGGLAFINSWDFPTYGVLVVAAAAMGAALRGTRLDLRFVVGVVAGGLALAAASVLLYLPFYFHLHSQAEGIGVAGDVASRPFHWLLFWAPFAFIAGSFLFAWAGRLPQRSLSARALVVLPLVFWAFVELAAKLGWADFTDSGLLFLQKVWYAAPLGVVAGVGGWLLLRRDALQREGAFVLLLLGLAVLLMAGPEFFYVKDVFHNRMNTVFKLYYQAWVLLAIVSAYALYYLGFRRLRRSWRVGWLAVSLALMAGAFVYSLASVYERSGAFQGHATLDGLHWTRQSNPGEVEALAWLEANARGMPVVVEAVGPEYSDYGRVSARTGLPTVLGWPGHELQWRGSDKPFAGREAGVAAVYGADLDAAVQALSEYDVRYVFVGSLERDKYGAAAGQALAEVMDVVYRNQEVIIYGARGSD